jgi:hypothetical protein
VDANIAPIAVAKFGEVLCISCGKGEYGRARKEIMESIQSARLPAGAVVG